MSSFPLPETAHCLNCGGVGSVAKGGPWKIFAPFDYARGGITLCGDPVGTDDHTRKGKFANPASMPYVATYAPGSIANFEYDITAHHSGYISFYLCDVSATGDVVNTLEYFKSHCHELERSPHPDCEAGTAKDCGPIDPKVSCIVARTNQWCTFLSTTELCFPVDEF
jgi:Lytic polysaccharide mono-oxygenase, cellulose-degrading